MKSLHKLLSVSLTILYFLYFYYFYAEISWFPVLFGLNTIALIINSRKLNKDYNERFSQIEQEFRLHEVNQDGALTKVLKLLGFVAFILVINYFDPFFQEREFNTSDFIYIALFLIVLNYTSVEGDRFFYFCTDYIVRPGYELDKIHWESVTHMDISEDNTVFWLNFRDGSDIKFDLEKYYTGISNEKVLDFVRAKVGLNPVEA